VNNAGSLALSGTITAYGQTISLSSGGALVELPDSFVTAATLNASAATGIVLGGSNLLTNLGTVSNTTSGGITFVNAGDPNLTGNISAPGQTVNLIAINGGFNQTAGTITAGLLNVFAETGIALTDANAVTSLGGLTNSGTGGVSFTNAGDFSLTDNVTATGQLVFLTSTNGSINQTAGAVTGQDIFLSAGAAANLIAVVATDQATVTATTLSVQQTDPVNTGLVAPTLVIESRSGLLDIGDNLNDPGFAGMALSQATLDSMSFDSISFYAGYFSPTNRLTNLAPQAAVAIKVGDIAGDFSGMDEPTGGLTASLFAGPGSTVEVLGSVVSTSGLGHLVVGDPVADTWTPKTIAISGSIGASGTTLAPLDTIELNATKNIVIGDSAFQTALQRALQSGGTSLIDINNKMPAGVMATGTQDIFIGSNTLILRAQGAIVSQNTGTGMPPPPPPPTGTTQAPPPPEDAGISLVNAGAATTVLGLGSTSNSRTLLIDIFGSLTDATGLTVTGKDLAPSDAIALNRPLSISATYRANGCVIGETDVCTAVTVPAKLIQGVILSTATSSDPETSGVLLPSYVSSPLITFKPVTTSGDPTITGVGNEEIWRGPSCDPKGDKACQ
jgi:hypothetical protein